MENATKYSYLEFVSKKQKLIASFLGMPSDFHYDEMVKLLGYVGFEEVKKGKTSGSKVRFDNGKGVTFMLHKPHPSGIMKQYQTENYWSYEISGIQRLYG
ncbi:type II toxin-antitoxin system HicA family toxin [Lunatimonas salinarum]|uniref:type II toxin-antitoxin system HicA family toxin n=1 Tax=Lunatimonas salinarum TaxID=1774590 RepID=UPI001FD7FA70|nr:type II toxin-antitoxin system HicA family toxin [Lunatimonas salinarum]